MTVANWQDVGLSLGRPLTDAERAQIEMWLGDAEMQIRLRLGDVAALDAEVVAYVEREAVAARVRNPEGYQYEAVDDYRYGMPAESRRVTILDEWWAMLAPVRRGTFYTVQLADPLDAP